MELALWVALRAKNILLEPQREWPVIAEERTRVGDIFYGYVLILATIPSLCTLIGYSIFFRFISFGFALIGAIIQYSLALAAIYFAALVAQWLAPKFGGADDLTRAMKLVAYAHTASWIGGVFFLFPPLAVASLLLAFYGVYLLYLGAVPVMGVLPERAIIYTVAVVFTVLVVFFLINLVMSIFLGLATLGTMI